MWKHPFLLRASLIISASLVLVVGCARTEPPEPDVESPQPSDEASDLHDVPLTEEEIAQLREQTAHYRTAVEQLERYAQTIEQKTTAGEPAEAHRALDEAEVVLERLPEAARDSGVPKAKWREVNETAQQLRDLFNRVHANIDAGEDPDYEAVAGEVDRAIGVLKGIEPEEGEVE